MSAEDAVAPDTAAAPPEVVKEQNPIAGAADRTGTTTTAATDTTTTDNTTTDNTTTDTTATDTTATTAAASDATSPTPEKDASKAAGPIAVVTAGTSPLAKLLLELPSILKDADYAEMWGVTLAADESTESTIPVHVPTSIVLEKFLRANAQDVPKARAQLIEALKWRKTMQPLKLLEAEYDGARFGDLGFVTTYDVPEAKGGKEIITWNIYGAVKDVKATFGNVQEFIKWRCALMELSLQELNLSAATIPIPANGSGLDPYRMVQVHDYLNVSFLRMDPTIRAATKETIQTFSMAYPELLKEKFFVNVPLVMGWVFAAIKVFLSPETVKKFHPLSYGGSLAGELGAVGSLLPDAYGGKGKELKTFGSTVKYSNAEVAVKTEEAPEQKPAV